MSGFEFEIGTRDFHWQVGIQTKTLNHARLMTEAGRLNDLSERVRGLLLRVQPSDLKITGRRIPITDDHGKYLGYYRVSDFTLEEE